MALQFDRFVAEDLNRGTGQSRVTLPTGGQALGRQISLERIPAGSAAAAGRLLTGDGAGSAPSWTAPLSASFSDLPTYADEAAATSAGLRGGRLYKTAAGVVRMKLPTSHYEDFETDADPLPYPWVTPFIGSGKSYYFKHELRAENGSAMTETEALSGDYEGWTQGLGGALYTGMGTLVDQYVEVTVGHLSWECIGLFLRGNTDGGGYMLYLYGSQPYYVDSWAVARFYTEEDNYDWYPDPWTLYDQPPCNLGTILPGDVFRAEMVGTTMTVYRNGVALGTYTDTENWYPSGYPGLVILDSDFADPLYTGSIKVRDWRGGVLPVPSE